MTRTQFEALREWIDVRIFCMTEMGNRPNDKDRNRVLANRMNDADTAAAMILVDERNET